MYFEDILYWILDIGDSFEYAKIPTEGMWRYFLVNLQVHHYNGG